VCAETPGATDDETRTKASVPAKGRRAYRRCRPTQAALTLVGHVAADSGDRFVYRAVDEYSGETLRGPTQFRRRRQLTQAELVQLLMQVYPLDQVCHGNDLTGDEAQAFCTPYSAYYPYFEERVRAYLAERCPAPEVEADAEEDEDEDDE